jgi:protein-L-isoaspartate(D-aspartate) O-methyltransferase
MNEREQMVETQLRARGVTNPTVLAAMACVPREDYVRECDRASAYADGPLAIDCHQTISQPYIVAYMTELLAVEPEHKILEIGTGSGYQTAVLLELTNRLFTVETIPQLHESVRKKLASSRLSENRFRLGDGHAGWLEEAPFDRIMVTAAAVEIPPALVEQLNPGGRLVIPIGLPAQTQFLHVITRDEGGSVKDQRDIGVRFVPLVAA